MKNRVLVPFLVLGALILITGLACGPDTTPTATTNNNNNGGVVNTQPPAATLPPQPTATESIPAYFTEEFNVDFLDNWSYFLTNGTDSDFSLISGNDRLTFDISGLNTWIYLLYDPYTYTNVRIDARVTNLGKNNNNVSFICRYTGTDWYEVNIYNSGLYDILYGKWNSNSAGASYDTIADGGSTAIRQGKDTNEYTVFCVDNIITVYINGVEANTVTAKNYGLREGQVGIGVSSFNVTPITVEFDWVTISEP